MSGLLTAWWVWISAALIFAMVEMLAPGHVLLGFALGAALVGLLLLGPAASFSVPMLLLLFTLFSLAAWLILRRVFKLPGTRARTFDRDINDQDIGTPR